MTTCCDLRDTVRRWVLEHLPPKSVPCWNDIKDAKHKERGLINGIFLPGSKDNQWYQYWKTNGDRAKRLDWTTQRSEELDEQPRQSVPSRCLEEYNKCREQVENGLDNRTNWEELRTLCEKQEKELTEYEKNGLMKGMDTVSFKKEKEFVSDILREWLNLEALIKR